MPSNRRAVHSDLLLPLFKVSAMRCATDSTVGVPSGCTGAESSIASLPMRSALLSQRISAAAALLQSTTVAVPGSNNQTAFRPCVRKADETWAQCHAASCRIHYTFRSIQRESDVFIQARQTNFF